MNNPKEKSAYATSRVSGHVSGYTRAQALDAADKLIHFRDRFSIPENLIYLDGNSLGVLPASAQARVTKTLTQEWGKDLITSWNKANWLTLPQTVGDKIAPLLGADSGTVAVADSTSINLFKALSAALNINGKRRKIISEKNNFPTDLYIAEGVIKQMDRSHELILLESADDVITALSSNNDVAVLMLTHINYRTGAMYDIKKITAAAHANNVLMLWDLAHSAGAVPLELADADVDFAVGCGYKYLNGGPGAPAFLYVAPKHQGGQGGHTQPLSGWFGHSEPFAFASKYKPSKNITQYLCGTPPVLSMVALDEALNVWADVDMRTVRQKSLALTDFFIECTSALCTEFDIHVLTPFEHENRGSQVSLSCPTNGYAVMQALIARNVIGDFRPPDILRFGFTPLYTRYVDVWNAAQILSDVLQTRYWDKPEFTAAR